MLEIWHNPTVLEESSGSGPQRQPQEAPFQSLWQLAGRSDAMRRSCGGGWWAFKKTIAGYHPETGFLHGSPQKKALIH